MIRKIFVVALLASLSALVVRPAAGDVRRTVTDRRPFIIDVGEPVSITMNTLLREEYRIHRMQEYIEEYGTPDYAEIQEIEPQWPWEAQEVRLYYLRRNLETDFGHISVSEAMPNYGAMKFEGSIPPEKRHEIEVILQAREAPPPVPALAVAAPEVAPPVAAPAEQPTAGGLSEALVARIEAAAERAAQAADQAAADSEAAMRAADRTANIIEKMEQSAR